MVESPLVSQSLKLILASDILFAGKGLDILDVRALNTWGLLCRYQDDLMVTFDSHKIEDGLRDLAEIVKKSREFQFSLASVNLAVAKNIPVTFHSEIDAGKVENFF